MRNKLSKITQAATLIAVSLAFTFLCSCASLHGARKITPEEEGKIQVVGGTSAEWISWQFLNIPPSQKSLEDKAVSKLKISAIAQGYGDAEIRNIEVEGGLWWGTIVFGYFPCAILLCNFQHITASGLIVKEANQ